VGDPGTGVRVRRAGERARTRSGGVESRHSFSFGAHYDPANTHFGLLVASNDDLVAAGDGYPTHPHRDVEIVTWVLEGALVHRDSTGRGGVVHPGVAQRLSAGSGVQHSEHADPALAGPTRFVQMWVLPDSTGGPPEHAQVDLAGALDGGGLVVVASGRPEHAAQRAVALRQRHAALHAARPRPGGTVALPPAPLVHVYVARGSVGIEGAGELAEGDAARVTAADGQRLVAGADGAEVLVWEMHATLADLGQP
jgi:quercetin 2,3-dioxygenase